MESNPPPPPPRPAHHKAGGGFRNPWPGTVPEGFGGVLKWYLDRARRPATTTPLPAPPPVVPSALATPRAERSELRITAVGHSTFLLQVGALNVLTDPVWGERTSPLPFAGPRRRHAPGIAFDALPPIDLVLLSHDHYDHLDDRTVRALARRHPEATWCAPVGVGARLAARGVRTVIERDWWEVASLGPALGDAVVTCVPAAHFSGRTLFDRDATLWCGWSIALAGRRVYFVGDTGSHPEFGAIGRCLGPLDVVMMPIGAYEPRWFMRPVHVDPDEALAAFGSLTASYPAHPTVMLGMHWGTFILSDEPPDEAPKRIAQGWQREGRPGDRLWILSPGETRTISSAP